MMEEFQSFCLHHWSMQPNNWLHENKVHGFLSRFTWQSWQKILHY